MEPMSSRVSSGFGLWHRGPYPQLPRCYLELLFRASHMPHSSYFLGLPFRILNMNPQKELLWGLRVMHFRGNSI